MISAKKQITDMVDLALPFNKIKNDKNVNRVLRNREIICSYFGFDGLGSKSMDEAGRKSGLTKEMVRQIINKFKKNLSEIKALDISSVHLAISVIEKEGCNSESNILATLNKQNLLPADYLLDGIMSAAELLELAPVGFTLEKINDVRFVMPIEDANLGRNILSAAIKSIAHNGFCKKEELLPMIRMHTPLSEQDKFLDSILGTLESFTWLNKKEGTFFCGVHGRNRLVSRICKIFNQYESITLLNLATAIERSWRKDSNSELRIPSESIIRDVAINLKGVIYANKEKTMIDCSQFYYETPLRIFEREIFDLINESEDKVLREKVIEDELVVTDKDKFNYSMSLNYSPLIQRLSRGVYGLVGNT
jgi:hypothetical protein